MHSTIRFLTVLLFVSTSLHTSTARADADDDALLAPEDSEDKEMKKVVKAKVGFVSLVPVGKASVVDADRVSSTFKNELEEASFELVDFSMSEKKTSKKINTKLHQRELKTGKRALAKGQKALKRLSFKSAKKEFKRALQAFATAPAALTSVEAPIQAYLGLAEIAARQGDEQQSMHFLELAATLNPAYIIPESYPPQFISQFQSAAKNIINKEQGAVVIDRSAKGARVFLDGQEMGKAPLRIRHIPVGTHYLRIFQQDVGLTGQMIVVEHDKEILISPKFFDAGDSKPLELLSKNTFSDEAAAAIAAKAKSQNLIGVIVGVVNKSHTGLPTALIFIDTASAKVRHIDIMNFDLDLLNTSIEIAKALSEIHQAQTQKSFSVVDDEGLFPKLGISKQTSITDVTLRYDMATNTTNKKGKKRKNRLLDDTEEDPERTLLSGGTQGHRRSLKDNSRNRLTFNKRANIKEEEIEEEDGISSILLWSVVAVGGIAIVTAAVVGGYWAYWAFVQEPNKAVITPHFPQ